MPNYRVSYQFIKLSDYALPGFTLNVEVGLTGNPAFPTPPATVAALTAARVDYETKLEATHNGGPVQTVEKDEARAVLEDLLRLNASYVQTRAGKDLGALLSSGYNASSTNRAQVPLPKATIASLQNNFSGILVLNIVSMLNARAYEVYIKSGTGGFTLFSVFGYARRILIPDLTPGQAYTVQVRAVGGSTGYSDYSDVVTRVVT